MKKRNVLFLCTGNSCRSQMGEALVNHLQGDQWVAYSAGTRPTGYVHPLALKVLVELGIDGAGLVSKSAESLRHIAFDRVFTVCDSAAEDCPIWLGEGYIEHIPFFDPAEAEGSEAAKLAIFRQVRDQIKIQIVDQLDANDAAWEAEYLEKREKFRTLAREALAEADAGETLDMVIENGRIRPQ